MINKCVEKYCKDYKEIENYNIAMNPIFDFKKRWVCHHKLETENSEGKRRLVNLTSNELKALETYYDRPPEELIFLTREEHSRIHKYNNIDKIDPYIKFEKHHNLFLNLDKKISCKILHISKETLLRYKKRYKKHLEIEKLIFAREEIKIEN